MCKSARFTCCKVIAVSHHETEPHFIFIKASPSFCNHPSIHLLSPSSSLGSRGKKYDRLLPTLPSGETCGASQYCVKAPFSTDVPLRQRLRSEWGGWKERGFLRCLPLTEMDGPRLHSQQGQRDTQPSWPPPSARPEPALSLTGS